MKKERGVPSKSRLRCGFGSGLALIIPTPTFTSKFDTHCRLQLFLFILTTLKHVYINMQTRHTAVVNTTIPTRFERGHIAGVLGSGSFATMPAESCILDNRIAQIQGRSCGIVVTARGHLQPHTADSTERRVQNDAHTISLDCGGSRPTGKDEVLDTGIHELTIGQRGQHAYFECIGCSKPETEGDVG